MANKKMTSDAVDILQSRYFKGRAAKRLAEAEATMADLAMGDRIRQLRERAGLTQAQLAAKLSTQPSQISRIEDADYDSHSVATLRRIAAALQMRLQIQFVEASPRKSPKLRRA